MPFKEGAKGGPSWAHSMSYGFEILVCYLLV